MRGFIFCVLYILIFSALLSAIPADLQGQGETPETIIPIDPSLITGFADSESYTKANFTGTSYEYDDFNARDWIALCDGTTFYLSTKKLILGLIWLGGLDICSFSTPDTNRGDALLLTEITADADEGAVRYTVEFASGDTAGYLVCYWNTTAYATATLAWNAEKLYFIHGVGFDDLASNNIGALLVSVLTLQLPEVPAILGVLLGGPLWVCIIYVLWYVITSMIPFVGGG